MSHPKGAIGSRLAEIRLASGFKSVEKASDECNRLAEELDVEVEPFTPRKLRRFESIGISGVYGTTPPTYLEIDIMLRVYGGSPAYLIHGSYPILLSMKPDDPVLLALDQQETINHVRWLAQLPTKKRLKIIKLLEELLS